MRLERLFHVLVVMSGVSAVPACDSKDDDGGQVHMDPADAGADGATATPDAAATATPDAGTTATADGGELAPCFCNMDSCCDRSTEPATLLDGFECCWSTTCP
jgi:hypothetical protein